MFVCGCMSPFMFMNMCVPTFMLVCICMCVCLLSFNVYVSVLFLCREGEGYDDKRVDGHNHLLLY